MTPNLTTLAGTELVRTVCALSMIGVFVAGCVGLLGQRASAHDITDANLTNRAASCASYVDAYSASATDMQNQSDYRAGVRITTDGGTCTITSNAVPNHDFNATCNFATPFREQDQTYRMTATPTANSNPTA